MRVIIFERLHKLRSKISDHTPGKFPFRSARRTLMLLFKNLRQVSFYLFEIIFAAKPAKKLKGPFGWICFHSDFKLSSTAATGFQVVSILKFIPSAGCLRDPSTQL